MKITQIKINGIKEPVGFALNTFDVSWKVTETESRSAAACRIEIFKADSPDSAIAYKEGVDLKFAGETMEIALEPRTEYIVRVSVTGDKGDCASAESHFETGKMSEDWSAEWIAAGRDDSCHPYMKKSFCVKPGLKKARLYATGVGMFEAYINGEKLGDEYLLPGVTDYEKRIQVITFPVDNLKEGENELSFKLGKGWFMGIFGLDLKDNNYGSRMAAIGELHLEYDNGTEELVCTDGDFVYTASDITESGIYFGETVERKSGADASWKSVSVIDEASTDDGTQNLIREHLTDRLSPRLRVREKVAAKEIITTPAGETVIDFGQNFAGFPEFDADFAPGTRIVLDFGEILQQGNFYRGNYRDANSQFVYVSGGRKETVHPSFTFFGFRYVKVTGWEGELTVDMFRGCVLYSDMDRAGHIRTNNDKINRLYENGVWGLKSNFLDMPTDCPQRSERLGWTGDAQIFAPTASYHMDTRAFFHKFEMDLMDAQEDMGGAVPNYVPNLESGMNEATSAWGDIGAFLPMTIWKYYGSMAELEYAYPMMTAWVDYMDRKDAEKGERSYTFEPGFQFGDWLALDGPSETSFKGSTDDKYLGAVYYYQSTKFTAEAAEILGRAEDAKKYGELAENIRRGILNEYFTPNGRFAMDTQASYIIALKFGLWINKERLVAQFIERLKKDNFSIKCGFVGAPLLCTVLGECGRADLAYDFLFKEDFPSWLYCVNLGATTIWERWNSVGPDGTISDTGMNSLNHYSYGSVMEFMYAYAAGIRPAAPGFRKAVIAPNPDYRLPQLDCSFDSACGKYVSNTRINDDGSVSFHIEIPFGCEAEVTLPRSGKPAEVLAAGSYDFTYTPDKDFRKPYDEHTPVAKLAENDQAAGILFGLVPPIGGMAKGRDPEFGYNGLADFRPLRFLPFDPDKLEEAISAISDLVVQ